MKNSPRHLLRALGLSLAALAVGLGSGAAYLRYARGADCCYPGAPCCHPGAPCCEGHARHASR